MHQLADGCQASPGTGQIGGIALLSHLAYEEQELVEPLARLGF
jgi:hypothetical protein